MGTVREDRCKVKVKCTLVQACAVGTTLLPIDWTSFRLQVLMKIL